MLEIILEGYQSARDLVETGSVKHTELNLKVGKIYEKMRLLDRAIETYRQCVGSQPKNTVALL